MNRYETILNGAAEWASYYRENPDKFVEEYLHIHLRLFQKILIVMMFWCTTFVFIACRGIGKTFLCAVYCTTRCILFPRTQICIVSGTRGQAALVLEKIINELKPKSPELCLEIDEVLINNAKAQIKFQNHSVIKVVTAGESARGNRCNVLVIDEFRLVRKDTIDTILKKFLNYKRQPDYIDLTQAERIAEYKKEKNLSMYLSSAWYKNHWSYTKCEDTFTAMMDPKRRQFVCAFPYQLSILEGLLDKEMVEDDMAETNFSEVKFMMEMCAMFYGSAENAFFDFESLAKNRKLEYPILPNYLSSKLPGASQLKIQSKKDGEYRLLSADIALMSSKKNKNDATSIFIDQMLPSRFGRYINNYTYVDSYEGKRTEEQALIIRKLFEEYSCDYIILDTNGVGLGVYDCLARDMTDPETGEYYPALSCCNDKVMADRCTVPSAPKVIWSIKANAQFNSDCAFLLREGFRSGRIRLLLNEYEAEEALKHIKGFNNLTQTEQTQIMMSYVQTTLLIDECVNLQHEEFNGRLRIFEKSGKRKDRYSSISYNNYVAIQIENKIARRQSTQSEDVEQFIFRAPSRLGKAVNSNGRKRAHSWG